MPSLNEIIEILFGGPITADKIANMIVVIYAIVMSFVSKRATSRAITADRTVSASETKVSALETEVKEMKQAIGYMGDIISTAFLSSSSLDINIKKELADQADKIAEVAHMELSDRTTKMVKAVQGLVPNETITKKKEDAATFIKDTAAKVEQVKEDAKDLIKKVMI